MTVNFFGQLGLHDTEFALASDYPLEGVFPLSDLIFITLFVHPTQHAQVNNSIQVF